MQAAVAVLGIVAKVAEADVRAVAREAVMLAVAETMAEAVVVPVVELVR